MKRRLFTIWVAVCLAMGVMTVTALAGDGAGFSPENPLEVPRDAMVIVGGTYYGIAKDWFSTQNPDKTTMYFSIQIPDQVTAIAENGFRDNYTPDKKKYSAVSTNDGLGGYIVTSVDFSQAVSLRTIKSQAAMGCALSGVLDLSNTQVSVIEKSAFNGCKGLTGVILPSTLEELGTSSSGSVFNGCSGLEFVRTAGGNPSADFELPERLTTIGRQCFLNAFAKEMDAVIPASVTTIGLEAFYTDQIHHVVVLAQDLSGYDGSAFRRSNYDERIIILPNAVSYKEYVTKGTTSSMRDAMSYPYTAKFESGGTVVQTTCNHLYGQTLDTQFDPATNTVSVNDSYALPAVVPPAGGWEPGYTGGWTFDNRIILTSQSVVNYYTYERDKCEDTITFVLQPIVAPPTVVPIVDGQPVEDGSLNVTVPDNGTHRIGVQVTHPLEQEPANPVDGDVYVDFRYKWTDVAGSFQGPRSGGDGHGGVAGWPDKEFNSWSWDYNTIPIEGTEHARSGENYYMVEIEGYYTRYDAATGKWSSGVLFFKTASTIFGGAGEETNYYPPYCFRVDVEEDPNYQRYQVQVGKTGEGTVTDVYKRQPPGPPAPERPGRF